MSRPISSTRSWRGKELFLRNRFGPNQPPIRSPPVEIFSVRKCLTFADDANPVINEFRMSARDLIFRHVTRNTVLRAYAAGCAGVISRGFHRSRHVTCQAPIVVRSLISHQGQMWIVAGHAGQTSVSFSPAAAVLQAIRREAQRERS